MEKEKFKITEWVAVMTLVIGLYCYLYNYAYWQYFGINAYDYFSYIDSLQRSVPLLVYTLITVNFIFFLFVALLVLAKKKTLKIFMFIKKINKDVRSGHYLGLSVVSLFIFVLSSSFVMPILTIERLSYEEKTLIVGAFFVLFTAFFSSAISLYAFFRNVERKDKTKRGIFSFFIYPIPFQIVMSIFYMPVLDAYKDENTVRAQVITKSGNAHSSHKMLALAKDFVFIIDDKNVVVRKISDVEYIYYNVDKVK
ncbi:hypothetical protein [Raoultella lignicola]|uniref:Uncharacterized protein n=1 Tax=Raoultella lignicola TaxID=3040939 RepID=A0ABU9FB02_9ENTR